MEPKPFWLSKIANLNLAAVVAAATDWYANLQALPEGSHCPLCILGVLNVLFRLATRRRVTLPKWLTYAVLFAAVPAGALSAGEVEEAKRIAHKYNAVYEVPLWDGSRVDLLSSQFAYEVDWAKSGKIYEAVGQAVFYAEMTHKRPAVILLTRDAKDDRRYLWRAILTCGVLRIPIFVERVGEDPATIHPPRDKASKLFDQQMRQRLPAGQRTQTRRPPCPCEQPCRCVPCGCVSSVPLGERVDVIELTHLYDDEGKHVFDQWIFWRMHEDGGDHVVAWRRKKCNARAIRDPRTQTWSLIWTDDQTLRRVRATSYRETWTQRDPEMADRQNFDERNRAGLLSRLHPGTSSP